MSGFRNFGRFVRQQISAAALAGASLGLLIAVLLLSVGRVAGEVSFDIGLSRADVPWFLVLSPLILVLLFLLLSPLSFALAWGIRRLTNRNSTET